MTTKYPLILDAVKSSEEALWKMADAIHKEAEENELTDVATYLAKHGFHYSVKRLQELRLTSEVFPKNRRLDMGISLHTEAGNPDTLDAIVSGAKKAGDDVTREYIRRALAQQRSETRERRRGVIFEAEKVVDTAVEAETKARETEANAKTSDQRQNAKLRRQQATEARKAAKANLKAAKAKVKREKTPAPDAGEVHYMAFVTTLSCNADKAKKLAIVTGKEIDEHRDVLSDRSVGGIHDASMNASEGWRSVAVSVNRGKKAHLGTVAA